jgi:hypothetical protein
MGVTKGERTFEEMYKNSFKFNEKHYLNIQRRSRNTQRDPYLAIITKLSKDMGS